MRYDFRARSDAAQIFNDEPSKTRQEFKASCDLNNILKKYAKNGINPFVITQDAKYGDFSEVPSYHEAQNLVISATDHFMRLPAKLRQRFGNDPGQLLAFLADQENRSEAEELGLVNPKLKAETSVLAGSSPNTPASGYAGSEAPEGGF